MKIHTSCETLPMWCFCQIPATGDYRYLEVRDIPQGVHPMTAYEDLSGEATEEHSDAWEAILMEYATLNKDYKVEDLFNKSLAMKRLEGKHHYIMTTIFCLSIDNDSAYAKEYIEALRAEGYQVNTDNKLELYKSLESIKKQAGVLLTRMKFLEFEIKKMSSNNSETKNSSFDDILVWVHSELGIMPEERLTVRRFVAYKEQILKKITRKTNG